MKTLKEIFDVLISLAAILAFAFILFYILVLL